MEHTLTLIIAGFIAGAIAAYFITKAFVSKNIINPEQYNDIIDKNNKLLVERAACMSREEVEKNYINKEWFNNCNQQLIDARELLKEKEQQIIELISESEQKLSKGEVEMAYVGRDVFNLINDQHKELLVNRAEANRTITTLTAENTKLRSEKENAEQRLKEFNEELIRLQELSKDNFKNLANEIFSEKSKDFSHTNKESLDKVLDPFKTQLTSFQSRIELTRKEDIADMSSLKKEIEGLQKLNVQLSNDAQKLAGALKSDVKIQGNWGEDRLKYILEAEGLTSYLDYSSQGSFKDEEQEVNRRPDYILHLPDGKHIIIDSKVSLNAYVEYFNCTGEKKQACLKQLVRNIIDHIDSLAAKNYQSLSGLNTPDFVCMFMGIEPALSLAISENPDIIKRAMDKKIVIITPTTTMATFKMIKLLWQKENRVKNVEEIFRQCGALYDKFVGFVEEFQKIGTNLDAAASAYNLSMNRLKDGQRKGDTILGKFENIKALDAKTNKSLPAQLMKEIDLLESNPMMIEIPPSESIVVDGELG